MSCQPGRHSPHVAPHRARYKLCPQTPTIPRVQTLSTNAVPMANYAEIKEGVSPKVTSGYFVLVTTTSTPPSCGKARMRVTTDGGKFCQYGSSSCSCSFRKCHGLIHAPVIRKSKSKCLSSLQPGKACGMRCTESSRLSHTLPRGVVEYRYF